MTMTVVAISKNGEKWLRRGDDVTLYEFVCRECGATVISTSSVKRYCSTACSQKFHQRAYNQRRRERPPDELHGL